MELYRGKSSELDIKIIHVENFKNDKCFCEALNVDAFDQNDIAFWRYSYWVERKIKEKLLNDKRSNLEVNRYKEMLNVYFKINSEIFFEKQIIFNVKELYFIFNDYNRLSARCSNEVKGDHFFSEPDQIDSSHFEDYYYSKTYVESYLTASTYIEHRSRLAILKAAVDYVLYERSGDEQRIARNQEFFGLIFDNYKVLPQAFRDTVEKLKNHPYIHRYPVFWQWFLFVFGGFILLDKVEEEYELFAEKTGLPVDHIDEALGVYDMLFPLASSWFHQVANSNMWLLPCVRKSDII